MIAKEKEGGGAALKLRAAALQLGDRRELRCHSLCTIYELLYAWDVWQGKVFYYITLLYKLRWLETGLSLSLRWMSS